MKRADFLAHDGPTYDPPTPLANWFMCTACLRNGTYPAKLHEEGESYNGVRVVIADLVRMGVVAIHGSGSQTLYRAMGGCPRCGAMYAVWLPPWLLLTPDGDQIIDWID